MRAASLIALFAGAACASSPELELEITTFAGLELAIPEGWTSTSQSEHQTKIVVFRPKDNDRKESITVMRTRELPALAKADGGHVRQLLSDAQRSLLDGKPGRASHVRTKHGFLGARVETDFVPVGAKTTYRRIHAVVLDGSSLVHVLYTARNANPKTLDRVLDSLTRKAT